MELQEALDKIKELETEKSTLENEKSALIRKRDELLNEVKGLKQKYAKLADRTDLDTLDIDELLSIKVKYEAGDSETQNKYKTAYETDKKNFADRLKAIEDERKTEKEEAEKQKQLSVAAQLRADVLTELSKESYGIRNPNQFYMLFGDKIRRDDDSKLVAGDLGKSVKEYVESIAEDDDNAHHFKPRGGSGTGGTMTTSGGGKVTDNPWSRATFNLTKQGQILKQNPELAKRLKAEAK